MESNAYIEVPDCEALNTVHVEEDMHPDPDTGNFRRPYLLTKPDTRFLPHHPCQSPTRYRSLHHRARCADPVAG